MGNLFLSTSIKARFATLLIVALERKLLALLNKPSILFCCTLLLSYMSLLSPLRSLLSNTNKREQMIIGNFKKINLGCGAPSIFAVHSLPL